MCVHFLCPDWLLIANCDFGSRQQLLLILGITHKICQLVITEADIGVLKDDSVKAQKKSLLFHRKGRYIFFDQKHQSLTFESIKLFTIINWQKVRACALPRKREPVF